MSNKKNTYIIRLSTIVIALSIVFSYHITKNHFHNLSTLYLFISVIFSMIHLYFAIYFSKEKKQTYESIVIRKFINFLFVCNLIIFSFNLFIYFFLYVLMTIDIP